MYYEVRTWKEKRLNCKNIITIKSQAVPLSAPLCPPPTPPQKKMMGDLVVPSLGNFLGLVLVGVGRNAN